ncbi:hypothetical protein D3C80_1931580 [compost metagenome]
MTFADGIHIGHFVETVFGLNNTDLCFLKVFLKARFGFFETSTFGRQLTRSTFNSSQSLTRII